MPVWTYWDCIQSFGQLEYHQLHLCIAEVMWHMTELGDTYGNIGLAYQSLGGFK